MMSCRPARAHQPIALLVGAPQRGDIAAARSATNPRRVTFHCVIGLPGDVLDIRGAQVTMNGRLLVEPDLPEGRVSA
ncbi:MAG: hypothetical protein KatS3mg052_1977 [Candidatus Roseilinea sp.]|nr:MAG: hypothetical protein KatS3mg052_1977 [Candidatus Roseilinea sp.]